MSTNNQVNVGLSGASGTGNFAGNVSPSFTTPALGTPSAGVLSSCTGYARSALTGLGTGVSAALGNNLNASSGIPSIVADTTWTPVFTSSGGGTATYSSQTGTYTQIGTLVFFEAIIILTGLPSAGTVSITGLPVPIGITFVPSTFGNVLQATIVTPISCLCLSGGSVIYLQKYTTGSWASLTVADCNSTSQFYISGFYHI